MNDQEYLVRKIRTQYTEKEHTALDELRRLDSEVKRPANVFGYVFGTIAALVMGAGMSLVMTDIGKMLGMENTLVPGIVIGVVGLVMALATYPLFKRILEKRKKEYAPRIIELSNAIEAGK